MFNQTFEKRIKKVLFKHNHTKDIKLYLNKSILLENCSTMDLFRNSDLVENITKAGRNIILQDNGGTLALTQKSKVPRYKNMCVLENIL